MYCFVYDQTKQIKQHLQHARKQCKTRQTPFKTHQQPFNTRQKLYQQRQNKEMCYRNYNKTTY